MTSAFYGYAYAGEIRVGWGACTRIFSCDRVGMSDCVGMSDRVGICDRVGMGELFHFRRSEKNGGERKFSAFIMIYHELKHSLIISFITLLSLFEPVEKFAAFFTSECEFSIEKL